MPIRFLLFLFASGGLAAFLHLRSPNLVDPDTLYHYRHAALYAEKGPLLAGFPWTAHSVMGREAGDLWYGFHLLLAPFTAAPDPVLGMKLAGIALLTGLMVLCHAALRMGGVPGAHLWPLLLFCASPPALMRLLMVRPHVLSVGLLLLLVAALARERPRIAALAAFLLAWIHLSLAWSVPLAVLCALPARRAVERRWERRAALAALGGMLAGIALRPDPVGAARLAWVQIGRLALEKQAGVPLLFGGELQPVEIPALLGHFGPFLALWLGAIALFLAAELRRRELLAPAERVLLWTALVLSVLFFELMAAVSLRGSDQWTALAVLFIAGAAGLLPRGGEGKEPFPAPRARAALAVSGTLLAALMVTAAGSARGRRWTEGGTRPGAYRAAAEWLRANARPGEIVFHARWEQFAELFYWNQESRYVSGMDPIFMYALDPRRYWLAHHLAAGRAARFTCPAPECAPEELVETVEVLRRDFQAAYLFVDRRATPELDYYARAEPRLALAFEDAGTAVFRVGR